MNVQLPVHIDKPTFLAWVQGRQERYELSAGRVVITVGASRAHGVIVTNLVVLLRGQLDPQQWTVIAEFGLDTGPESLRYPDVVIDQAGGSAADYVATAPLLVAEVLSPTTAEIDLGDKAAEYLRLSSLAAYLIFAQSGHKTYVWAREGDEFSSAPSVIAGRDKIIHIPALNLALPLAAIYAGIEDA